MQAKGGPVGAEREEEGRGVQAGPQKGPHPASQFFEEQL